jgi:hypothetical protein
MVFDGGTCAVGSNQFIGCHIGIGADGVDGAMDLNNSDNNMFIGIILDGDGSDNLVDFDTASQNNILIGSVDGGITDNQATAEFQQVLIESGASGSEEYKMPWITMNRRPGAPATTTDGTMWVGSRDAGAPDTLFIRLDGADVVVAP